ncbi:hypothetical protein [Hyphococcus sp.]|uniref:hypothetical protein n=1 Tax=Hyphococcus sp. TaxID=2038636 RepID=UPI0035C6BB44
MNLFWLSFLLFLACLIAESITSFVFIKDSKKRHPALWEHAGKPTLLGNGDLISAFPLIQYAQARRYESLADEKSIAFADRIRMPMVISYYAAVVSALIFIAVAILTNL